MPDAANWLAPKHHDMFDLDSRLKYIFANFARTILSKFSNSTGNVGRNGDS
jgi:hypothetical protein